jgi:phosphoserine phosphatase
MRRLIKKMVRFYFDSTIRNLIKYIEDRTVEELNVPEIQRHIIYSKLPWIDDMIPTQADISNFIRANVRELLRRQLRPHEFVVVRSMGFEFYVDFNAHFFQATYMFEQS